MDGTKVFSFHIGESSGSGPLLGRFRGCGLWPLREIQILLERNNPYLPPQFLAVFIHQDIRRQQFHLVFGNQVRLLIGGNLTLIATLMGTPYEPNTRGAILFLEDVGEEPYRIDRMLTQLRLAGKLQQAAGIIIGECADCTPSDIGAVGRLRVRQHSRKFITCRSVA